MLRLLRNTSPQNEIDLSRRFGNLQLPSSVIADEGNWRLPKRLESHGMYVIHIVKGSKNVFYQNQYRCIDDAPDQVAAWRTQLVP